MLKSLAIRMRVLWSDCVQTCGPAVLSTEFMHRAAIQPDAKVNNWACFTTLPAHFLYSVSPILLRPFTSVAVLFFHTIHSTYNNLLLRSQNIFIIKQWNTQEIA